MAVPPPRTENGVTVGTTTKKELVDRIADLTGMRRTDVRDIVQLFLDGMVEELADGNRLEFRDFGVFEVKHRAARIAQNPKTLEPVPVPERSAIRFKAGRLMKMAMEDPTSPPRCTTSAGTRLVKLFLKKHILSCLKLLVQLLFSLNFLVLKSVKMQGILFC